MCRVWRCSTPFSAGHRRSLAVLENSRAAGDRSLVGLPSGVSTPRSVLVSQRLLLPRWQFPFACDVTSPLSDDHSEESDLPAVDDEGEDDDDGDGEGNDEDVNGGDGDEGHG